jgi:plasmid maintenance system antidote protein VapI
LKERGPVGSALTTAIRQLLAAGLTPRDVAELLRAHERAIEALIR